MKNITLAAILLVMMAVSLFAAGYRNVGLTEAKRLIDQKKNVFLLDVRTSDEYRQARMKGSVLIPINEIERRIAEVPRNRPILIYCAVGSRSGLVAGFLAGRGYAEVYNMQDGLVGWYRSGYPIEK